MCIKFKHYNIYNIMENNLDKLKSLGRIGGKGSVRRKKLNKNKKVKTSLIKTKNDLNLEIIIIRVNNKIMSIDNDEEYESFFVSMKEILFDYTNGISKNDFKNKDNYKKYREEPLEYFEKMFINNTESRVFFNKDISIFKNIFVNDSINYFIDIFHSIENILENKKYLEKEVENNKEDELNLRECYELFDLDYTNQISKDQLHKKYKEKSLLYHPDRHTNDKEKFEEKFKILNMSYKFILKNI